MSRNCLNVLVAGLLGMASLTACGDGQAGSEPVTDTDYVAEIETFRSERLSRLKAEDGYLNLAGLFWLREGSYRFGAAADNDIVFPPAADDYIGTFEVTSDGVVMTTLPGTSVMHGQQRVDAMLLHDDTTESPVTVTSGSLAWIAINREGRYAIRLRDYKHPALEALPPIPQFGIDPAFRVVAELEPYDAPRVVNVGTVIEGLGYNPESPGVLKFEIDGQQLELEAYTSGERLFLVFGDRTSGRETYPAGRFLYADGPGEDGLTVLDFNKSYNPPCAFGDFSTCPVATPRNRMPINITAGEKYDPGLHVTALVYEHADN